MRISKLIIYTLISAVTISTLPSCKSKKKCPDFTQVDGKIKRDKHGLVKKKKARVPRTSNSPW